MSRSLTFYLVVSALMLAVGGYFTSLGFGPWYDSLTLPPWQPPGWAFSPAWITLLTLLAFATARVMRTPESTERTRAITYYWMQVILNVAWSGLFFASNSPIAGLICILALDIVLGMMIWAYGKVSKLAAWMLVPYLLWSFFATSLNWWIENNN